MFDFFVIDSLRTFVHLILLVSNACESKYEFNILYSNIICCSLQFKNIDYVPFLNCNGFVNQSTNFM